MKDSANILEQNSVSISDGADSVSASCDNVLRRMKETADNIHSLNSGVKRFEGVLNENRANMMEMDALYPEYNFKKHKAYGTKEHYETLAKYGASPIHRMTFKGVKEYIR